MHRTEDIPWPSVTPSRGRRLWRRPSRGSASLSSEGINRMMPEGERWDSEAKRSPGAKPSLGTPSLGEAPVKVCVNAHITRSVASPVGTDSHPNRGFESGARGSGSARRLRRAVRRARAPIMEARSATAFPRRIIATVVARSADRCQPHRAGESESGTTNPAQAPSLEAGPWTMRES